MTSNVVPADDDLVYALTNIARGLKYGPDQAWIEEAIETIASLSSELARCRNALEEALELLSDAQMLFAHGVGAMTDNGDRDNQERNIREAGELNLRISNFIAALRTAAPRPALNPIGEEGAREP
jgi:hypothetical protein